MFYTPPPQSFQGKALGPSRLAWMHLILWPFTISSSFSPIFTSCLKRPCTVSYLGRKEKYGKVEHRNLSQG